MTSQEIITILEETYSSSDLLYEKMLLQFLNLSGIGIYSVPMKKGSRIVRARYSDNLESFVKLVDVSYPQKHLVESFSRLNRPYQNLFYGSESVTTCLTEMLPFWLDEFKTGDRIKVTLGTWILDKDLELLVIPDTSNLNGLNRKAIEQMNPEESPFWDYISSKFKATTKDDKNIYEFTAAFANALILKSLAKTFDGFIYSSVQQTNSVNIALNIDVIDSKFLVPTVFQEILVERTGIDERGLPTYFSVGNPKMGSMNSNTSQIEWNI